MKTEKILLGLRCSNGVEISLFDDLELKKIDELIEYDKVYIEKIIDFIIKTFYFLMNWLYTFWIKLII